MPAVDAVEALLEAAEAFRAADQARTDARKALKRAVRRADKLGYPREQIARRIRVHRNTVASWCDEEDP